VFSCNLLCVICQAFPGKGYDSHRQRRGIFLTNQHIHFLSFYPIFLSSPDSLAKFTFPRRLIPALPQKCIHITVVSRSVKLTAEQMIHSPCEMAATKPFKPHGRRILQNRQIMLTKIKPSDFLHHFQLDQGTAH